MLSVHAASHGAGHTRPVNSGKLLVECSTSSALLPLMAVHEIVPVGNDVVDRAAGLAERDAAVHAARALLRGLVVLQRDDELAVVAHAQRYRLRGLLDPLQLEEPRHLPHQAASRSFLAATARCHRRA